MTTPRQEHLLRARYGRQAKPEAMIWNDQIERLLAHRSVRTFLPDPLPTGALEAIVAAAQSASTSSNLHQWSVIAVTDPQTKKELTYLARSTRPDIASPHIQEAPVVLLWVADMSRNHEISTARGEVPEAFDYLDSFLTASIDTALAAQSGAVAAESMGLGVCYLGLIRNHAKAVADLLGLPEFAFVAFGMCVGRPDPDRASDIRPRPRQDVVLHRERYQVARPASWLDDYESALEDFRQTSGLPPKTWADAVTFAATTAYLDGREHLRPAVTERGYLLR